DILSLISAALSASTVSRSCCSQSRCSAAEAGLKPSSACSPLSSGTAAAGAATKPAPNALDESSASPYQRHDLYVLMRSSDDSSVVEQGRYEASYTLSMERVIHWTPSGQPFPRCAMYRRGTVRC